MHLVSDAHRPVDEYRARLLVLAQMVVLGKLTDVAGVGPWRGDEELASSPRWWKNPNCFLGIEAEASFSRVSESVGNRVPNPPLEIS